MQIHHWNVPCTFGGKFAFSLLSKEEISARDYVNSVLGDPAGTKEGHTLRSLNNL